MKVASPVGDFPFQLRAVRREGRHLVIDGTMGAWPARVEVGLDDVRDAVRVVGTRQIVLGVVAAAGVLTMLGRRR